MHQLANFMTATRPDPSIDLSELERDYIVKRELGKGGMGSVFLARHRLGVVMIEPHSAAGFALEPAQPHRERLELTRALVYTPG